MLGINRWHLLKVLAAMLGVVGASSLLLLYFMPAPPSTISTATSQRGGGYEFLGQRYRAILARVGVRLELLQTGGSAENIALLEDENSGVKIGFLQGGVSNSQLAPSVMSLGRISYQPFWIFYRGKDKLVHMQQLKAQRIAVGAEGSGTQVAAMQIFGLSGITPETATLSPLGGASAVQALRDGSIDAAFFAYSANAPIIQSLMRDPDVHLMSMSQTEALTRIFPHLVQLKLPQAVIDFARNIPGSDVSLIGTTNAVVVRKDLHPQIVLLLAQAVLEEHRKAGLFEQAGQFPTHTDPEFDVAEIAVNFYKNGHSFLHGHIPFWLVTHVHRLLAVSIAVAAIFFPLFNYAPKLYTWLVRERLRSLYRRLRTIEASLQKDVAAPELSALEADLDSVDRAANILGVPMRHSDLFFSLKVHIDLVRTRLGSRRVELRSQIIKAA
jgi:TRAP-type uncharacterized transport system substrate-binding protein